MSRRDPLALIHQMQDCAIEARDLAAGRSRSDLDADMQLRSHPPHHHQKERPRL